MAASRRRFSSLGEAAAPAASWKSSLTAFGRALALVAVLFLAGELAVRKFADASDLGNPGFREFQPHPLLFWQLRPNLDADMLAEGDTFRVRSNSEGLRNAEIPFDKAPNAYRILCLGDSITYGYGVEQDETYEARLQSLLRRQYPAREVDVINGGCPGYSSYQGMQVLKRIGLRYQPDVLVVGFIYADPATEAASDLARGGGNPAIQGLQVALYQSRLYVWLRRSHLARQMPTGPREVARERTPRVSPDEYEANMREFADIMKARGGHVIYLNLAKNPNMANVEKWLDPHQERYDRYRAIMKRVAAETGNVYIDVDSLFAADPRYFLDPIHPNAEGFRRMAEVISERMVAAGWIDQATARLP